MLIDTHCHLNHDTLAADGEAVIARAFAAGISTMIVVGFDPESNARAVALSREHACLFASVGIHPHDAAAWNDDAAAAMMEWAADPRCCAIGEIGLDYYRDLAPRDVQHHAFRAQLLLARRLRLPVIIHCRDAYTDTLDVLEEGGVGEVGGVMHCWAGGMEDARRALNAGMHLGFGGTITYKNAETVRDALRFVPADRLLLETDAPYLAPVPHRGKANEPAYIRLIVEQAASIRGVTAAAIEEQTTANALACFPRLRSA